LPDLRRSGLRCRPLSKPTRATIGALGALVLLVATAAAVAADEDASLKIPRFVSLHADQVNLRTGPGRQYPIEWVLTRKEMPVEIIAQFEHWRRIRDWEGTVGWVQQHMIAGKRTVIVAKGGVRPVYRLPDPASAEVARAQPGVIARLLECRGPLCRIEADDISGWMRRSDIWGVLPEETVP
jgi:SH3-like domain-containing protein